MFMLICLLLLDNVSLHFSHEQSDKSRFLDLESSQQSELKVLIQLLIEEVSEKSRCIVSITDTYYRRKVDVKKLMTRNYLPIYRILVKENEEFSPPRRKLLHSLQDSKYVGCDIYLILMTNGLQIVEFLKYTEEERLINAHGKFVFMYDFRIFHKEMRYLWNRIINVVFIRHYTKFKRNTKGQLQVYEWYDLNTVHFPARVRGLVTTKYIDTWYANRFRYGINHFASKTRDLRKQKLRVAVFEHIPAVTEDAQAFFTDQSDIDLNSKPLGIEFEMLLIIARVLNFQPEFYYPENIQVERWGSMKNSSFTGIFGEAKEGNAIFYLGDLYYTMHHLQILDLSWPYNTECLTFLTLESLSEDSWKLLILPFALQTWLAVIFLLCLVGILLFFFARFYKYHVGLNLKKMNEPKATKISLNETNRKISVRKSNARPSEWKNLHLFTDPVNSILYTYSMLLQVSLPDLPKAWSLRVFIGWWWIFTILITVFYKASMTASLANAIKRVTIDTIGELVESSLPIASWNEETKDSFSNFSDANLQQLSERHKIVVDEQDAIAAVANGSLCYYESLYVLGRERVKRQILEVELQKNGTEESNRMFKDHNLHVMEECVINMPVSLGMDKHSPLKSHVDKLVKQIIESGFVQKWLSDVVQQSKVLELRQEGQAQKALIDLDKLLCAMVALIFGYFLGILALAFEIWYWKKVVMRDPNYNKYRMDLFYKKM
ncbi:hypothetical protein QAD02_015883 [Eretmocerus hayati]|uniref:Uncharacterized protein n=1 Tax=Eretmocerus hayati TaxID=131215 RepID=A0ACC2PB84_9HYME|nr:hypothetical protein QAD02_015883 [Eretmocerus hayati]